ncbi:MAG: FAD-dependent oxidoreductase [Myxococcales bacterium]|nr:FAD-dependent oxidoreductase [Myxococcales bacterium]
MHVDVAIVGAGLAGLAAARALEDRGLRVAVVEARDRVGGRTLSEPIGRATFDLGGQWIGAGQRRLRALIDELGLATFPTRHQGIKILERGDRVRRYRSSIPSLPLLGLLELQRTLSRLDRLTRGVDPAAPWASPRAAELDGISLEAWKRRTIRRQDVRDMVDLAIRSFLSAEASEVSLLHLLAYAGSAGGLMKLVEVEGGAQESRFVGGAQGLTLGLRERLRGELHLTWPCRQVSIEGGRVRVRGEAGELSAERVILALPPHLTSRIDLGEHLPQAREQLHLHAPIGATIKVLLLYRAPFWRDQGLSGEALSTAAPFCFTYDNSSHDDAQPALVAFVTGDMARRWGPRPAAERHAAIIDGLVRAFGPAAREVEAIVEKDWGLDPWARGCPAAFLSPGVLHTCGPALRAPAGPIHFAGTETAREWNGYLEGALESAERVVGEIVGAGAG